jgi:hypothetical protein
MNPRLRVAVGTNDTTMLRAASTAGGGVKGSPKARTAVSAAKYLSILVAISQAFTGSDSLDGNQEMSGLARKTSKICPLLAAAEQGSRTCSALTLQFRTEAGVILILPVNHVDRFAQR